MYFLQNNEKSTQEARFLFISLKEITEACMLLPSHPNTFVWLLCNLKLHCTDAHFKSLVLIATLVLPSHLEVEC